MYVGHTARWALLLLELSRGQPEAAVIQARELTTQPLALRAALDRIDAAVRAGDADSARPWLDTFAAWADTTGAAWAHAAAEHGRALLCEDDDAEPHFVAALELHAGARRPFDRARAELAFGEHLRRARRRLEAREHLRAALDGFEALGAAAWADRARTELRASGQTARRRDVSTLDELTAQEQQIAAYVAEGLSNPRRRRAALPQPAHDRLPPAQRLPQAGHQLADRARAARLRRRRARAGGSAGASVGGVTVVV